MKKILFSAILLCLAFSNVFGQTDPSKEKAVSPLNLPISFAGTYGELRHNHFHSGFDWRVGGKVGDPIHAIKSGYVCRISVSTGGYGNAVYISHPDSTMSVYGHMYSFAPAIADKVIKEQYSQKNFSVNIYLKPNEIPVIQGDVIGTVGSTGASSGPHLHMEVRRDGENLPFNYVAEGYYKVVDKLAPVFHKLIFYAFDDESGIPVTERLEQINVPFARGTSVSVPQKSYVCIDATDRMEGTSGKLAVEVYEVILDGKSIFKYTAGNTSYSENRYIQSIVQYGESYEGGRDVVKSHVDPCNALSYKIKAVNDGLIVLNDTLSHDLKILAADVFGNSSSVSLKIKRDDNVAAGLLQSIDSSALKMLWYTPNMFESEDVSFMIPSGALYNSIYFSTRKVAEANAAANCYSQVWSLGDPAVPMQVPATIRFKMDGVPENLWGKALIAAFGKDGKLSSAGGKVENGNIVTKVRFGTYCIAVDTLAPTVDFLFTRGGMAYSDGTFRISANDNLSGIASFSVEVDGQWVLSSLKKNRITVYLQGSGLRRGSHKAVVRVTDGCDNTTVKSASFNW